jgi:hypothetical protein
MNVHFLVSAMADGSPPKRQKTEDVETDGCVYPISYDALVLVFEHLSTADLYYAAFASTVFYEIAMREMRLRTTDKSRYTIGALNDVCRPCHTVTPGIGTDQAVRVNYWPPCIAASSAERLAHFLFMCKRPASTLARTAGRMYMVAAQHGATDALSLVDDYLSTLRVTQVDAAYDNAFMAAEVAGHLNVVQWLATRYNNCYYWRETPGKHAAYCGHEHIVRWVVENGHVRDTKAKDAIVFAAASSGNVRMVHWLRARGIDISHTTCRSNLDWYMVGDEVLRLLHDGDYAHLPCMARPPTPPQPPPPVPQEDYDSWGEYTSSGIESDTDAYDSDDSDEDQPDPPPDAPPTPDQAPSSPED